MGYKLLVLCHFTFLAMINTIVGAGAASRYGSGSGSDQMMRLLAAPAWAPQHCYIVYTQFDSYTMFGLKTTNGEMCAHCCLDESKDFEIVLRICSAYMYMNRITVF
jgi:hypothetical protein